MYLNMISASSVQKFINSSVIPKQLANSSEFVASIMKNIMQEISDSGNEIIYPNLTGISDETFTGVGNTIIFSSEESEIDFENYINKAILMIYKKIFKNEENILRTSDPLEFYYVEKGIKYEDSNYIEKYEKLMQEFLNVKLNRNHLFEKEKSIFEKEYCDLCGGFHTDKISGKKCRIAEIREIKRDKNLSLPHLALGDYLKDKKDLVKKIEILEKLVNKHILNSGIEFIDELAGGNVEIKENKIYINEKEILKLNDLETELDEKEILELNGIKGINTKYLAIYRLDIDNTSKNFSIISKDEQKKLSKKIIYFMNQIKKKIDTIIPYAQLIYAGGDDVLILLPLKEALNFPKFIKGEFQNIIQEYPNITYTQGIFIIGFKNDFSECLRNSERLLVKAKQYNEDEKDNIVISIVSEGYSTKEIYFKNSSYENFICLLEYFKDNAKYIHQELDKKFGILLKTNDGNENEELLNILNNEISRLSRRKKIDVEVLRKNLNKLERIKRGMDFENFINIQSIIRFLNKVVYIAEEEYEINENNTM